MVHVELAPEPELKIAVFHRRFVHDMEETSFRESSDLAPVLDSYSDESADSRYSATDDNPEPSGPAWTYIDDVCRLKPFMGGAAKILMKPRELNGLCIESVVIVSSHFKVWDGKIYGAEIYELKSMDDVHYPLWKRYGEQNKITADEIADNGLWMRRLTLDEWKDINAALAARTKRFPYFSSIKNLAQLADYWMCQPREYVLHGRTIVFAPYSVEPVPKTKRFADFLTLC
jgi:hypothetical protein